MAHPVDRVTNQAVLEAIKQRFGLQFPPDFNMSGAQNSTFSQRVYDHLRATGQPVPQDLWTNGVRTAKDLELINRNPEWSADNKFLATLAAYGISEEQRREIYEAAKNDPSNKGGIREAGKEVSDVALQTVTRRILGDTFFVQEAERRAGLAGIPAPGAPPVAQPPAPAGFVNNAGGGDIPDAAPSISGATGGSGAGAGAGGGGPGGPGASNLGQSPPPVKKVTPAERRAKLEGLYGWAATFMDDPEVAKIINDVASGAISEDEADRRWKASNFYKTTSSIERQWAILEKSDPEDAKAQLIAQEQSIISRARGLGFEVTPERARQIAITSKKYGWSDQQIAAALASEVKYDPNGAKTGVLAQIKQAQRDQLVPLSDQAMTQWAQSIVGGERTLSDFQAYLKDQAKSLFPTIGASLDTMTVRQYLSPYEETAKKTLGQVEIDWQDPKWFRFVNAVNDKGERGVMSIADMQRTLITDPAFQYDKTENGKAQKAGLAQAILEDWGFRKGSGTSGGDF